MTSDEITALDFGSIDIGRLQRPHYGKHDGDAEAAHGELAAAVRQACGLATDLARLLGKAQSATAGLETAE